MSPHSPSLSVRGDPNFPIRGEEEGAMEGMIGNLDRARERWPLRDESLLFKRVMMTVRLLLLRPAVAMMGASS